MVFRPQIGSTFADTWYRIAQSRPRLSPHAGITPQRGRGEMRYIVEEPAGGKFFYLSESANHFAGFLDGQRSVEEAWEACNAQLGDDAPTQAEIIELLANLQLHGFLLGDQPIESDMLAERRAMFRKTHMRARTGNYLFYHIPLINPEPILNRLEHLIRPLFTPIAGILWCVLVLTAIGTVLANLDRVSSNLNSVLSPSNLFFLWLTLIVVRGIHEAGHAIACKAVGARCTEIGLMLVAVILPLPYCDATSSWKLPERSKRVLVSLGGLIAEAVFASAAVFIWATSEPGDLRTLSFNVMIVSGISSIVFNLNPLLRYDGYYILADVTDTPNLAQRARATWIFMTERFLFDVRNAKPPHIRDKQELALLVGYQALAFPYRLFVLVAIVLLVSTQYLTVGVVLACVFAGMWCVWPILKACWYLATSPKLVARRARAVGLTAAIVVPILLAASFAPVPTAGFASGTVEPDQREIVRVAEPGFIEQTHVTAGQRVEPGDLLFTLSNPALTTDIAVQKARIRAEQARLDQAESNDPVEAKIATAAIEAVRSVLDRLQAREDSLQIRASVSGVIASPKNVPLDPRSTEGLYLERGEPLVEIVGEELVIRAQVTDADQGRIFSEQSALRGASVRVRGSAAQERQAEIVRVVPFGSRESDQASLTAPAGGRLLTDPTNPDRLLYPHFRVDLHVEDTQGLVPGTRAEIRFGLAGEPVMAKVLRAAKRYLDGRFAG